MSVNGGTSTVSPNRPKFRMSSGTIVRTDGMGIAVAPPRCEPVKPLNITRPRERVTGRGGQSKAHDSPAGAGRLHTGAVQYFQRRERLRRAYRKIGDRTQ